MTKWPLDIIISKQKICTRKLRPRDWPQIHLLSAEILLRSIIIDSNVDARVENEKLISKVPIAITKANSKIHELV